MRSQNPITPQIEQTINYYTNRLARSFRLQPADKDDIRQELTLKALEAMQCYSSDMEANIETYTIQALRRKAVDLAGAIIASPSLSGIDTEIDLPTVETNTDLIMDVQEIIGTLPDREQTICRLLMAGCTQEEIGRKVNLKKTRVSEIVQQLKSCFSCFSENERFFTGEKMCFSVYYNMDTQHHHTKTKPSNNFLKGQTCQSAE